jgi:hypothetical protein
MNKLKETMRVENAVRDFFQDNFGVVDLNLRPGTGQLVETPAEDNPNLQNAQAGRKTKLIFSFD